MTESLEQKMARIAARLERECPVCEARTERSAIMEYDGQIPRAEADRLAEEAWPCQHTALHHKLLVV